MALLAHFAPSARLGRVHGDAGAGPERIELAVQPFAGADFLHHTGKFMAERQRRVQHRVADARVLVAVQIAAADAHGADTQQHFIRAGRTGVRNLVDAQVLGTIEANGSHGCRIGHS